MFLGLWSLGPQKTVLAEKMMTFQLTNGVDPMEFTG